MPFDPLDLWPDTIRVNPLSPLRILQLQAPKLSEKTQGLLTAEVLSGTEEGSADDFLCPSGKETVHRFEVVAPRLNGYRYQMFVCRHDAERIYPVYVEEDDSHDLDREEHAAATQDEFTRLVRKLLGSKQHLGVITSLLARIAESDLPSTATA